MSLSQGYSRQVAHSGAEESVLLWGKSSVLTSHVLGVSLGLWEAQRLAWLALCAQESGNFEKPGAVTGSSSAGAAGN